MEDLAKFFHDIIEWLGQKTTEQFDGPDTAPGRAELWLVR
jgi:hypothetical protein